MRDINKLLILLRSYFSSGHYCGLCSAVFEMYQIKLISSPESVLLSNYLYFNKPKKHYGDYWFRQYSRKPRIEWLDKHILLTTPVIQSQLLKPRKP